MVSHEFIQSELISLICSHNGTIQTANFLYSHSIEHLSENVKSGLQRIYFLYSHSIEHLSENVKSGPRTRCSTSVDALDFHSKFSTKADTFIFSRNLDQGIHVRFCCASVALQIESYIQKKIFHKKKSCSTFDRCFSYRRRRGFSHIGNERSTITSHIQMEPSPHHRLMDK